MTTMLRRAGYWIRRLANPPSLVIRIDNGSARPTKGTPPPGFVAACNDVARDFGINSGYVEVVPRMHGATLRFSPDICQDSHQRFRNVWGAVRPKG